MASRRWSAILMVGIALVGAAPALAQQVPMAPISSGATAGGVVGDIFVEGTQRIEPETVLSYIVIKPGDVYDPETVDISLKRLFATGLFSDVAIKRSGDDLIIRVLENPIINRVVFEGNRALDDEKLDEEVQISPRTVFTKARVQSDVTRIVELYRRSGRFAAKVTPEVVELPQNRVDLIFRVSEGPVTGIGQINFIGNRAFNDRQLKSTIVTRESRIWTMFSPNDNYDPDRVAYDRELLRQHYLKNGYADFSVVSAVAELTPGGESFILTYTVDEGAQYTFGDVKVETELQQLNPEFLQQAVSIKAGETFNSERIEDAIDGITFLAGTFGYAFVDVRQRMERDTEARKIDITLKVNEGPRVYVERINIVGNTRTLDKVVRREMRVAEGDAFNRILIDRSKSRIRALGFFKEVEITENPGSAADRTVVDVKVEEQPTGELSLGFGFSSDAYVGDVSISERNLLGRGQYLRLRVSLSNRQQQIDLRFTEPYFLDRQVSAGFDIYKVLSDYEDESGFRTDSQGLGLRLGFPINEHSSLALRYLFEQVDVEVDEVDCLLGRISRAICDQRGQNTASSVGYTFNRNMLNDPLEPSRGTNLTISQDFAGVGGDDQYLRSELQTEQFWPFFFKDTVLSFGWNAGYLWSYTDENTRINQRFFKGGSTFRGFEPAGIGPRDILTDDALGGRAYAIGTLQLKFPLPLPEEFGIDAALFSQVGTLGYLNNEEEGGVFAGFVEDDLSWRGSYGISFFWDSPFGPVRIDLAHAFMREDYDKTEGFRFSAGTRL